MHVSVCMLNSASIACFYIYSREIYHIILYFSFILQWTVRLITLHTLQWVQTKHLAWQALQLILWWILVSYSQAPLPHPILPLFSTHPTQDQSVTSLTCHGPVVHIPWACGVYTHSNYSSSHTGDTQTYARSGTNMLMCTLHLSCITCTSSLFNARQTHSTSFNTCTNTIERHRHACIHQSLAPLPFPFSPLSFPF